ncbi:MAG: response regulator [Nitrospirae bacterium]|nr:response regulator [Nitrospirota bacterium]
MVPLPGTVTEDRPSVLVVDDLWSNLELMEAIFASAGFEVFSALGASSALSIFDTHKIDIAILDVMMPGMDGFELCRKLKSMTGKRFFPVVLLTALTDRQSRITGLECGADDFISKPFDAAELTIRVRSLIKLKTLQDELEHSENVILTLAVAMESRDPYTRGHSTRVGDISMAFASFLGFSRKEQEQMRKAGILHDIGKIGVSTDLLCKDGRLTGDELEEVKRHTIIGEEICRPLVSVRGILPVIRSHHERWDGRGFPDGLRGEEIPVSARLLSIADSFDAMVSKRPYRGGRSASTVVTVFRDEKHSGQWDPKLLEHFVEMITRMEPGGGQEWSSLQ